ncbi:hypothetical protein C8R43DRAFT_950497 [Mycena crocata]|nr:hypothetical protein C8R43DRAFT_950497 [Mycena crocata]
MYGRTSEKSRGSGKAGSGPWAHNAKISTRSSDGRRRIGERRPQQSSCLSISPSYCDTSSSYRASSSDNSEMRDGMCSGGWELDRRRVADMAYYCRVREEGRRKAGLFDETGGHGGKRRDARHHTKRRFNLMLQGQTKFGDPRLDSNQSLFNIDDSRSIRQLVIDRHQLPFGTGSSLIPGRGSPSIVIRKGTDPWLGTSSTFLTYSIAPEASGRYNLQIPAKLGSSWEDRNT